MHSKSFLVTIMVLYHLVLISFVNSAPLPVLPGSQQHKVPDAQKSMAKSIKLTSPPRAIKAKKTKVQTQQEGHSRRTQRNPFLMHNLENMGHSANHRDLASALGIHMV
ncbi:hypothetical protein MVEG_07569 [Podila verticillata NRRL 6337]|nr:MAG: hypothetical protein BYD32DRAFT_430576 [Podila humilis]KFH67046.1 hypothetical protein MVEG_07569 [Podila verticillata NRRL 6337]